MNRVFKTVDIFAGPGGLAEGFSSLRDQDGRRIFEITLSVEKEASAFETLRLRAFTRQFEKPPASYYQYLAGEIAKEEMIRRHVVEWAAAVAETVQLELGTKDAQIEMDSRLDAIMNESDGDTIVIGGPPCQAYSLVGRARNRGVVDYDAAADHRHFLYKEYIRILGRLKPVAFVMENVKGILSSKVEGRGIFELVIADLKSAGGYPDSYTLIPLVEGKGGKHADHIIRSELFGIPQNRHRVILLGIRSDLLAGKDVATFTNLALKPAESRKSVFSVISGMPTLRSGLSKGGDSPEKWQAAAVEAFETAAHASSAAGPHLAELALKLTAYAAELAEAKNPFPRISQKMTAVRDNTLATWLSDPDLETLPNHQSRGHMQSDLARYAFAATFAEVFERSPKADEYPLLLAPDHRNWESGKFADRFRVQRWDVPSTTITSHISKDGHYFIHPDPMQCRSLTVREAARLQTFPDNYFFEGNRTQQYVQVGNAVPPFLARQIAEVLRAILAS